MIDGKKIVALCTSRVYDSQQFELIKALGSALKEQNFRLLIYTLNSDLYWMDQSKYGESAVFDLIPYDKVDVVVIMDEKIKSVEISENIINRSKERNIPIIVLDGKYEGTSHIHYDYYTGFENVVRHIIEYHHVKRPHFMAGYKGNKFSEERLAAFKKVLSENDMTFSDDMVSYGDFWAEPSRRALTELLSSGARPDAVICANDIMAINVCDILREFGMNVPSDVLVSGFDGMDEAFMSNPGITTASCDSYELAEILNTAIINSLEQIEPQTYDVVPRFIANDSCGCERCTRVITSAVNRFNSRFYRYQDDIRVLHDMTANMMSGKSPEETVTFLRGSLTHNMCCIANSAIFKRDRNYFLEREDSYDYSIIYDSYCEEDRIIPYKTDEIVPELLSLLEAGYPLIFNSLDYMGKSVGFICYSFPRYDIIDYAKTPSITDAISMGLGGYVNMRYQNYLLNKVHDMYRHDALTGLYNRLAFKSAYYHLKDIKENIGQPLTIIMSDLDGLKIINDSMGHSAGDKAITAVAEALKASCPDNALCVRFGGDEMLALIPGSCSSTDIMNAMQDYLSKKSEELGFEVSASMGAYTTVLGADLKLEEVINLADEQMYKMKKRNKMP